MGSTRAPRDGGAQKPGFRTTDVELLVQNKTFQQATGLKGFEGKRMAPRILKQLARENKVVKIGKIHVKRRPGWNWPRQIQYQPSNWDCELFNLIDKDAVCVNWATIWKSLWGNIIIVWYTHAVSLSSPCRSLWGGARADRRKF